jgi:CheY-like chemotaxis protein
VSIIVSILSDGKISGHELAAELKRRLFALKLNTGGNLDVVIPYAKLNLRSNLLSWAKTLFRRSNTTQRPRKLLTPAAAPPKSVRRLLWVDDQPDSFDNQRFLAQLQQRTVYTVVATSTRQALELLSNTREPFDAVLSDMGRVEDGVYHRAAGIELLEAARQKYPALKFIFYTTHLGVERYKQSGKDLRLVSATTRQADVLRELGLEGRTAARNRHEDEYDTGLPVPDRDGPDPDDPHKGQWGGRPRVDNWYVSATFGNEKNGLVDIHLKVASENPSLPLEGDVTFYLHPSFIEDEVTVEAVGGAADLQLYAWGGFTVGVWIQERAVELELDLAQVPGAPRVIVGN